VAQGVIEAGDPVLLADFENTSDDPNLARIVTEAPGPHRAYSPERDLAGRRARIPREWLRGRISRLRRWR